MNRRLILALGLCLSFSSASAAPKHPAEEPAPPPQGYWVAAIGPLLSLPLQDINPLYTSGVGGSAYLGYSVNRDVMFQLDIDNVLYTHDPFSDDELRVLPTVKFLMGEGGFRPYLTGGLGLDFQFAASPGQSATGVSLEEAAGLGIQFKLDEQVRLFLEGKCSFIFSSHETGVDLPVDAGVEFGL